MQPTDPMQSSGNQAQEIIQKGMAGAVLLPVNPTPDAIAAATAIYLGLTKLGKSVTLVCDTNPKSDLTAADKITQEVTAAGDNLVISFPYKDGSIDKVDYNIQGETFNLIIVPRPGQAKLNTDEVCYSYSGGAIDFIITIDAPNLHSLGHAFSDNKTQFQGKTIINIDRHLVNDFFGTVNIVNKTSSSTSELALQFLQDLDIELDKDMATNLYAGITAATNNFTSYSVNAQTFEAAATLLKHGALKKQVKKPGSPQGGAAPMSMKQPMAAPQEVKSIEAVEQEPEVKDSDDPSEDWLKPKIFRGTGLI